MENQKRFFEREDFKSPIVLGFIAIYIFCTCVSFLK